VQDLNNRFLDGRREVLQAYCDRTGADAIQGADAATGKLTALRDAVFGQTASGYQRQRLGPILDTHLAAPFEEGCAHIALGAVHAVVDVATVGSRSPLYRP
jgi:hypothetical protein